MISPMPYNIYGDGGAIPKFPGPVAQNVLQKGRKNLSILIPPSIYELIRGGGGGGIVCVPPTFRSTLAQMSFR